MKGKSEKKEEDKVIEKSTKHINWLKIYVKYIIYHIYIIYIYNYYKY